MDYIKKAIWGPDPKEQHRKCKALIRRNSRQLEKSIRELNALQKKSEKLIKTKVKHEDYKAVRIFAKELYSINNQLKRLNKSKAQLDSIGMQIDESFGMLKLQENIKNSTIIMKDVNSLVKLSVISDTMRELERELVKSGIINEMIGDTIDGADELDEELDEEVDEEIDKIVSKFTDEKLQKVENTPSNDIIPQDEIKETGDDEVVLNEMRERLKALQS